MTVIAQDDHLPNCIRNHMITYTNCTQNHMITDTNRPISGADPGICGTGATDFDFENT